ncbi:DUF6734 family protein [Hydrotalea sp.]|uniref:DUF6734 family protein n=1 Tax=Hydrotalea sp. TaxID=2881279 RepID=UPI00342EE31B
MDGGIPFDGDVYVWNKFSEDILKSDLLVQNLEIRYDIYKLTLSKIRERFKHIPSVFT